MSLVLIGGTSAGWLSEKFLVDCCIPVEVVVAGRVLSEDVVFLL